jgi:hypothetical protein
VNTNLVVRTYKTPVIKIYNCHRKHLKPDSLFLTKYNYFERKKEPK